MPLAFASELFELASNEFPVPWVSGVSLPAVPPATARGHTWSYSVCLWLPPTLYTLIRTHPRHAPPAITWEDSAYYKKNNRHRFSCSILRRPLRATSIGCPSGPIGSDTHPEEARSSASGRFGLSQSGPARTRA